MVLMRFVFGLCESLNDCSAKHETVGATLDGSFPKITSSFFAEKVYIPK